MVCTIGNGIDQRWLGLLQCKQKKLSKKLDIQTTPKIAFAGKIGFSYNLVYLTQVDISPWASPGSQYPIKQLGGVPTVQNNA